MFIDQCEWFKSDSSYNFLRTVCMYAMLMHFKYPAVLKYSLLQFITLGFVMLFFEDVYWLCTCCCSLVLTGKLYLTPCWYSMYSSPVQWLFLDLPLVYCVLIPLFQTHLCSAQSVFIVRKTLNTLLCTAGSKLTGKRSRTSISGKKVDGLQ